MYVRGAGVRCGSCAGVRLGLHKSAATAASHKYDADLLISVYRTTRLRDRQTHTAFRTGRGCVINEVMKTRWFLTVGLLWLATAAAPAVELRIQGEKIWLQARREPLIDVLRSFSRAGVCVKVDTRISTSVTADLRGDDLQQSLDMMLQPYGYVLVWDVLQGPLGPLPRLGEIQVFIPGEKKRVKALPMTDEHLEITTGPAGGARFVKDEVLISFRAGTRRSEVETLLAQLGGMVIGSIPELGIYRVRFAPGTNIPALVEQLAGNPVVGRVEPNYVAEIPPGTVLTAAAAGRLLPMTAARSGAPPMAILDSGLGADADLGDLVVGRFDAMNPERALDDPVGHGTQMALIAAGAVAPDGSETGDVARGVPLVAIRAFDDKGNASNFSILRSIDYALSKGVRVMNLSWGSDTSSEFLQNALAYARMKGMVIVAAAGNTPTGKAIYPAGYAGVLAVSATGEKGTLWSESNYGDFVSFAAPGTATFPAGSKGSAGSYAGTSIASAYVSRALALYFSQNPTASVAEAIDALKAAATDAGAAGRDPQYGFGSIDAAAVARLLEK